MKDEKPEDINRSTFDGNQTMLDLLFGANPITDDDLRALIKKRPEVYTRFSAYLGKR